MAEGLAELAGCWADTLTATINKAHTLRETNRRETDIDSSFQHYVPEGALAWRSLVVGRVLFSSDPPVA